MKKKGFTLIELLAVIIILAIIALIAVPIIMGIIENSKESAFKDTAYGIVKAGELYYSKSVLVNSSEMPGTKTFDFSNKESVKELNLKGSLPSSGYMKVYSNGKIELNVCNDKYCAVKEVDVEEVTITKDGGSSTSPEPTPTLPDGTLHSLATTDTSLGVTEINACLNSGTCSSGTVFAIHVNANETYKFYVVSDNGTKIVLLMDRNVGNKVAWLSEADYVGDNYDADCSEKGPLTALNQLESETNGWIYIPEKTYNLTNDGWGNGYGTITRTARARMLTVTEAKNNCAGSNGTNCPAWLYDHSEWGTGAGYWFSSAAGSYNAFAIRDDSVSQTTPDIEAFYGVRAVIELVK